MKIHFVHFAMEDDLNLDKAKMDRLKKHFQEAYSDYEIKCSTIVQANIEEGIQEYIHEHGINLIAVTTHKRGVIEKMFNPSLTKKMLFHTHIPLLVFHS
jgi:nucleotide-binding universal stress UspA family protein